MTMALLFCDSRLNSVDLPTLGRPTMATMVFLSKKNSSLKLKTLNSHYAALAKDRRKPLTGLSTSGCGFEEKGDYSMKELFVTSNRTLQVIFIVGR